MGQKLTFVFEDDYYGPSESWWYAKREVDLNKIVPDATELARLRGRCLGLQTTLFGFRLSDDDIFRDSKTVKMPTVIKPSTRGKSDNPYSCANILVECGTLNRCTKSLTGIPDEFIENQKFAAGGDTMPTLTAFFEELKSKWGILCLDRSPVTNPEKRITAMTNNAGLLTVTSPAHGLVTDDQIRIRLAKVRLGKVGGLYHITKLSDDTFSLQEWSSLDLIFYQGRGVWRKQIQKVLPITDIHLSRPGKRKRGVGFFRLHGSSKKRKVAT